MPYESSKDLAEDTCTIMISDIGSLPANMAESVFTQVEYVGRVKPEYLAITREELELLIMGDDDGSIPESLISKYVILAETIAHFYV